jgi:hypothetical protein
MPGTITIDAPKTFATMIAMSVGPKLKFGTDQQDISASGERKWTVQAAVTYLGEYGMRPVSEVVDVTITRGEQPVITPGQVIELVDLRCGISAPERRDNGRISGGRLYFMASDARPASVPAAKFAAKQD